MKLLIVVDMQNDFVDGSLGSEEAQAIVPNVVNKVQEYIDNGYEVIFTKDTHYEDYDNTLEGKLLPVPHCKYNTKGWDIIDSLAKFIQYDNVYKIHKETFAFLDWNHFVDLTNYTEIELVGLCTDICVVSNALVIRGNVPNTVIKVDASCCAGVTPEKHKAALEVMKSCQIEVINE